ncbi:sialic acid-binding Ig-like lectin 12 [Rhinoraja longicauda]
MEDQNCSLTLKDLRSADSGKYFFRLEGSDKWSDPIGVNLLVSGEPEMPEIGDPGRVVEGRAVSLTCSLHSYCPDDAPQFLWHPAPLRLPRPSWFTRISTGSTPARWNICPRTKKERFFATPGLETGHHSSEQREH